MLGLVLVVSFLALMPSLVAVGAPLKWFPLLNTRKKAFIACGVSGVAFAVSLGVILGTAETPASYRKPVADRNAVERASALVEQASYIPETKALIVTAFVPPSVTDVAVFDQVTVLMHDVARGLNDMPEAAEAEKVMVNVFAQLESGKREQVVNLTYGADALRKSLPDSGALIMNGARDSSVRVMLRPGRDAWCVENGRLAPNFCNN